jgi:predicted DNA-binding transcriptional regulator AlpA
MPKPSPAEAEPLAAFTIKEFCQAHGISVPFYYELKKSKHGPAEMRMGCMVRISREAAAAWRRDRENPDKAEAEATATTAKAMQERARGAAKSAVKSQLHISNVRRAAKVA